MCLFLSYMYKVNYLQIEKDPTYDDAYYSSVNNGNTKWEKYYFYLKDLIAFEYPSSS